MNHNGVIDDLQGINVNELRDSFFGACFHGETWVRCPCCNKGIEINGSYLQQKDGYFIIKCKQCGSLYRSKK